MNEKNLKSHAMCEAAIATARFQVVTQVLSPGNQWVDCIKNPH